MRKYIYFIPCLISFVLLGYQGLMAEEKIKLERLELIKQFPLEEQEVFFKTTPKIVVDTSGYVYALDNRQHTLFKFDKNGNFIKKIGKRGQGPGELQYPFFISLGGKKIYISDNVSISIFETTGKYINRFRKFRLHRAMAIFKDRVLVSESNTKNLITLYDQSGKILNSFGDIFKYDQNGNLIKKKEIEDIDFLEKNKKFYFSNATINKGRNKGLHLRAFFNRALFFENKIYLLLMDKNFYGEIWQLDETQLEVERKYSFFNFQEDLPTQIKSESIGIFKQEGGNNLNFYISFYSAAEFFINVYKREM